MIERLRLWAALGVTLVWMSGVSAQNKITYQNFDWHVYESPHFDVHYYPETEPFLEEIVSHAESAYLVLSQELDHELRFRVPLVVYKTQGEFQQTNITLSELPDGVAAFAEPVQNRMVLPIDLPPDKLYQLIAHELTHIFQYSMFYEGYLGRALRSNPPLWLIEGMASYMAQDEDNFDQMVIRDAVVNNILPPIQALNVLSFLTYRYGHAVFDYIEQEHGKEGLKSFLFEFRKVLLTGNIEKAIEESFGYDIDTFNRRFNRYLRRKYFPILLEKNSPDDYGEEIGVKKPGVLTFSPTLSPSGELIAVLTSLKQEVDLVVLSADDGSIVKNLTKGWTNAYRNLVSDAFEGKRDLSWSPTNDEVAVLVRRENRWPLLVFDAITGKKRYDIELDGIVECASPAFSPDGKRVAFEGNRDGVVDIFEIDLETRAIRNLTQDDFFDANPAYADDGSSLIYNRRIGSSWKVFSVSMDDPARKTQLTFGSASDLQPSISRDGTKLFFSSDRGPYGVFNIHAMDLATGSIEMYTDLVGGAFAPVEMSESEGERRLVFTAFFEGGFRLYRMPLRQAEQTVDIEEILADPIDAEPFEPPLNLTVDQERKQPYSVRWDLEAPTVQVGVADDGTFLSNSVLRFSDLLGDHRLQVVASSVSDFANYNVSYFNLKRRFNWGASAFDFRDYFFQQDISGSVDREQSYRQTGAEAFIQYPISRYYRVDFGLGFLDTSQDVLSDFDFSSGRFFFDSLRDRYGRVRASISGNTARYQRFGPFQGKRFTLGVSHLPHLSGDSDGDITEFRFDFRAYKQLTRRSVLALRTATVINTGDREYNYGFGGVNQLRGFEYREFFGSRLAWMNLELRFPLVDRLDFPILSLGQIRGFLFFDVGAAWFGDDRFFDPELQYDNAFAAGAIRVDPSNGRPIPFDFWDSDENRLQDGRASYGTGFQFLFIGGLQFNWVWSKRLDYTRYTCNFAQCTAIEADTGGTRMDFFIAFDF